MGITGHFIDKEWRLKQILLDFIWFTGAHDGKSLAHVFMKSMKDLNIHTKASDSTQCIWHLANKYHFLFVLCIFIDTRNYHR